MLPQKTQVVKLRHAICFLCATSKGELPSKPQRTLVGAQKDL